MDFKVAGTANGINALQMDVKVKGITYEMLERALKQARNGRLFILEKMQEAISDPEARSALRPQGSPRDDTGGKDRGADRTGREDH